MKYFSIPEPCTEDWSKMSTTQKGAFCQKCSNEVHDVSRFSNNEIIALIASEPKVPCMRMTPQQEHSLNLALRDRFVSQKRHMQRAMLFSLLVVFGFTLFSCSDSQQIHERNLMQSAAESIVAATDTIPSEEVTNAPETKKVDLVEAEKPMTSPVVCEEIDEEIMLLGEPMVFENEQLEEEVDTASTDIVYELQTVTMGIPIMKHDIPHVDRIPHVKKELLRQADPEVPKEFTALAYPNPAATHSELQVAIPQSTENLAIRLLDMNGSVLQTIHDSEAKAGNYSFRIDLIDLAPAYYLIDVRFNDSHKTVRLSKAR